MGARARRRNKRNSVFGHTRETACEGSGHGWWASYIDVLSASAYLVCVYCGRRPGFILSGSLVGDEWFLDALNGVAVDIDFIVERRRERRYLRSLHVRKPHGVPRKRGQDSHFYRR